MFFAAITNVRVSGLHKILDEKAKIKKLPIDKCEQWVYNENKTTDKGEKI
jgi:hypothetical protein